MDHNQTITLSSDVIARAASGDRQAFEVIYRALSPFVYNVAWRLVHTREDAQEVTQEVFMAVYRKLKDFQFNASLKTWVYRITINMAINYGKKVARHQGRECVFDEQYHEGGGPADIEIKINQDYQQKVVADLLKVLTPDQKACVVLRNIEGLSYQEIADTLQINLNTVRSRLSRARDTLLKLKNKGEYHDV